MTEPGVDPEGVGDDLPPGPLFSIRECPSPPSQLTVSAVPSASPEVDTEGARRVRAELVLGRSMSVGRCTVELVMRQPGLADLPRRPKYRKVPNVSTASDLVSRDFARTEPNRLWRRGFCADRVPRWSSGLALELVIRVGVSRWLRWPATGWTLLEC